MRAMALFWTVYFELFWYFLNILHYMLLLACDKMDMDHREPREIIYVLLLLCYIWENLPIASNV